jgi:integrase
VNRELATLSKMLHLAYEHGKLHRLPVIKKLREADPREGFVTREQFNAISRHLPVELQVPALVAFTLGWRKREVLSLRPRQLNLQVGTLRLEPGKTKNREGRLAHLTPELKTALAAQADRMKAVERKVGRIAEWLFPHLDGAHVGARILDPRKAWAEACKRAGLPGILFHDLRRSAVRNLEQARVPRSVAMKITGHKTESVYRRYAIVSDADLAAAARQLAASAQ